MQRFQSSQFVYHQECLPGLKSSLQITIVPAVTVHGYPSQDQNPQPPKLTTLFNATKKIQLKRVRHQHHLQNYLYYRKNNIIIPKGLVSNCRPTIVTNNPHFHEQWRQNQLIPGQKYLKSLIRECRKIIRTLEEQFAITKECLLKNSSVVCFNYYNEKLSSMARSLEVLFYNR